MDVECFMNFYEGMDGFWTRKENKKGEIAEAKKTVGFFSGPCFLTVSDRFEGAFCLWGEFGAK